MINNYGLHKPDRIDDDYFDCLPILIFIGISSSASIINAILCYPGIDNTLKLLAFLSCVVFSFVTLVFVIVCSIEHNRERIYREKKSRFKKTFKR